MKKFNGFYFYILSLLLSACASTQNQSNCNNFKQGKFKLSSHFDNSYSIIERHDTIQTETNSKTGQVVTAKVIWTNSCEYELQYQAQTRNSNDTINSFLKTRPLKTKIIKVGKDYCIFEAHVDNFNLKYTDTLWRLKN
jgi:hypothetical protein